MRKLTFFSLLISHLVLAQPDEKKLWQPYYITPRTGTQHLDLSGDGWELSCRDQPIANAQQLRHAKGDTTWFATTVPNSVQWSLYKAGKLPHPYLHKNTDQYQWVDEKVWYYRKAFRVGLEAKGKLLFLCFDGIDYFARVWLNGQLLGTHEGVYGGPSVEIGSLVQEDTPNELVVEVKAANWGNKGDYYEQFPRSASGSRDYRTRKGFKPQDPGNTVIKPWLAAGGNGVEMFFPLGIWRGVRLEMVDSVHLERPYLVTKSRQPNAAELDVSFEVFVNDHSLLQSLHPSDNRQLNVRGDQPMATDSVAARLELLDGSQVAYTRTWPLRLHEGRNWVKQVAVVANPKIWSVNGMGKQHRYQVRLTLLRQGKPLDALAFRYGIRTLHTERSPGPQLADNWHHWQYVVNGQKLFVKGINWMFLDPQWEATPERYRWFLEAARNAGMQMIRVNGSCLVESDFFYDLCDELGLLVWQDFPMGNQVAASYPQSVWEAQVVQNIFRLRNHPALATYCGGNEFNAYHEGNTVVMGILERSLAQFDPTRPFIRTSPDGGAIHTYPDMDPTWYSQLYRDVPFISETGIHSLPEASLYRELVNEAEFTGLGTMWDPAFEKSHPEFIHHFTEYGPARVPKMLSRASHITNVRNPTLEAITEASQVGAGEFYQILSEEMQGNYPVTTGILPWVLMRTWPTAGIQLMDGFGNAGAPYYFLKRTYEPTHVAIDLPRLLWAAGENLPVNVKVTHAASEKMTGVTASVAVLDEAFKPLWEQQKAVSLQAGPSVNALDLGNFPIPAGYRDRYLFLLAELRDETGKLISRSYYFPRCLTKMEAGDFREKYLREPVDWITLDQGPWLKPVVGKTQTALTLDVLAQDRLDENRSRLRVKITNTGKLPAFMTRLDVGGTKRATVASDNFLWLAAGETRQETIEVLWREPATRNRAVVSVSAWNAPPVQKPVP